MFNIETIQREFSLMVGVLPALGKTSDDMELSTELRSSDMETFWNDLRPVFTLDNFKDTSPELNRSEVRAEDTAEWSSTKVYKKYDLVKAIETTDNGQKTVIYESVTSTGNTNKEVDNAAYWLKTSMLDVLMRRLFRAAASQTVTQVINTKIAGGTGRSIVQLTQLYGGTGRKTDFISTANRFVGFTIDARKRNTALTIHSISTQFDQIQNGLKIYLYDVDKLAPVKEWEIDYTTAYEMQKHSIEPVTLTVGTGSGVYKIGYYEADISGHAIKRSIDFEGSSGCTGCNAVDYNIINAYKPIVKVRPFYVPSTDINDDQSLWGEDKEFALGQLESHNWGLNLQFSVTCDLTEIFVQQKRSFLEVYKQQLAVMTVRQMIESTRQKESVELFRALALMYGGDTNSKGLYQFIAEEEKKLQGLIAATALDFSGVDSICFSNQTAKSKVSWGLF